MLLYNVYILYSILIKYSTGAKISNSANFAPGILYTVQCTLIVNNCRKFKCQGIFVDTVK